MGKWETQKNGPENKKVAAIDDDDDDDCDVELVFISEKWNRNSFKKQEGRGLTHVEDYVDASIPEV